MNNKPCRSLHYYAATAIVVLLVVFMAAGCAKWMNTDQYWRSRLDDVDTDISLNKHHSPMYNGMTLLMVASSYGNLRAVEKLLMNGADPLQECVSNELCALTISSELGFKEICSALLKCMDRRDPRYSKQLDQAFICAVHAGNSDLAALFLQNGAHVESCDDEGWSMLSYAVLQRDLTMIRVLLEHGASVNAKSKHGATPLHVSALNRNGDVSKLLLDMGADVGSVDENGCSPISIAATITNEPVVCLLLMRGADPNSSSSEETGTPILYKLLKNHQYGLSTLLLERGARTAWVKDGVEYDMREIASWLHDTNTVNYLDTMSWSIEKRLEGRARLMPISIRR